MKDFFKHIRVAALGAMACALLMTGCVPQEKTSVVMEPDLTPKTGVEIDFVQVHNDVMDAFGDDNPYVFITDVYIDGTNDPKAVTITATCLDEANEEDAEHFAAAVVRRASDAIATQVSPPFNIKKHLVHTNCTSTRHIIFPIITNHQ